MNAEHLVIDALAGFYLAMICGFVAFVIACPFIITAGWLPARWHAGTRCAISPP